MAEVEFHEERRVKPFQRTSSKGIAGYLIRGGFVKDERKANVLLIIVAVLCIVAAIVIFMLSIKDSGPPSEAERRQLEARQ
jgi:hypothetical protein